MLLAAFAGAGWAWLEHRETVDVWTARATGVLERAIARHAPPRLAAEATLKPTLERIVTRYAPVVSEEAPTARSAGDVAPEASDTAPSGVTEDVLPSSAAPLDPLPPPVVDPGDALQAKALTAGLHPGLSRALLEVLTETDFANATIAIRTALEKTPDGEAHTWPALRKAKLAQYEVTFVTGTRADCRRYVVRIAKSGWLTTALPMERCGLAKPVGAKDRTRSAP